MCEYTNVDAFTDMAGGIKTVRKEISGSGHIYPLALACFIKQEMGVLWKHLLRKEQMAVKYEIYTIACKSRTCVNKKTPTIIIKI